MAADVSPDRHNRVSDEFIERSTVIEHHRHHAAEVTVKLRHQRSGLGLFRQIGEADQVRKEHGHRLARPEHGVVIAARVIENFFDQIFRNVTLECPARAQFFQAFQGVFKTESQQATR